MLTFDSLQTAEPMIQPVGIDESPDPSRNRKKIANRLGRSELSFAVENDSSLIDPLVEKLCQHIKHFSECSDVSLHLIETALHEAITNAMFHGNLEVSSNLRVGDGQAFYDLACQRRMESPYCERQVHIRLVLSRFHVVFSIRDEGPGFNPTSVPDPVQPNGLTKPFGRGLTIMRHCMNRVSFNAKGNQVTMIKRLGTIADSE